MPEFRLSPAAQNDLHAIFDYTVERWGLEQAAQRIPPWIVVNHSIGLGQVQPYTSSLQADQEQVDLPGTEALDGLVTLAGLPGQLGVGNAVLVDLALDQAQHGGELRKQQHAPTFVNHFRQQVEQQLELG